MSKNLLLLSIFLAIMSISLVNAYSNCVINVSLLNQDPIKAVPGEYVKVVFQITGVDNAQCGTINFQVNPSYPFSLDPGVDPTKVIQSGTYTYSYNSQTTIPYSLRVASDAISHNYTIDTQYYSGTSNTALVKNSFAIDVENVKTDFDLLVQNYDPITNIITLDIVNTGDKNVAAMTAEVLNWQAIGVKGPTKDVIGALDAGQDTTFSYQIPTKENDINLNISYTDLNGVRRSTEKSVHFYPELFPSTQKSTSPITYIVIIVIIAVVVYFLWKRFKKKKSKN